MECVLPLSPPVCGSKSEFLNKIQFQWNKVCYKVSLCENFQWQGCSITTPLFNVDWRERFNLKFSLKMTHGLKIAEFAASRGLSAIAELLGLLAFPAAAHDTVRFLQRKQNWLRKANRI